jgi:predicted dehydrogenase
VVVATPTETHYDIIRTALLAGKDVLAEKPLCRTGGQAADLVQIASQSARVLMVGHVFLFNPGLLKLKELLENGDVGKIYHLSATRTNLGPVRRDVNAAYDLAAHDIAIFSWLLGCEPTSVSATGACFLQHGIEDVVFISLKYPQGVLANIHTSWLSAKKVRQIQVVASRKMLTWDDLKLNSPLAVYDRGAIASPEYHEYGEFLRISTWDGDVRLPKINLEEPLKAQARVFLEAVRNRTLSISDGRFGAGVVRALEAVDESLRAGGAPMRVRN